MVKASGAQAATGTQAALREAFDYEAALAGCARGERAALQRIYQQEASRLLGVALRIVRRRDVADEVLHDAFLNIMQKASSFSPARGSGRGWIYTIVRHEAINKLRDTGRETPVDDDWLAQVPDDPRADPLALLEQSSEADALRRCLEALEENRRRCILLAFNDGLTHDEVAKRVQAPLGTVKTWIRRGLISLRDCLS